MLGFSARQITGLRIKGYSARGLNDKKRRREPTRAEIRGPPFQDWAF